MNDLNKIFADNLIRLRKQYKLTQAGLADKLSYSDKNISKWENGISLPTVDVLVEIAKYFSVTTDYLITEHKGDKEQDLNRKKNNKTKSIVIGLAMVCVLLASTICFVTSTGITPFAWMAYVYSAPVISIVLVVLISIFFKTNRAFFVSLTILNWTVVGSAYTTVLIFFSINWWFIFLIGIPLQIAIILWHQLIKKK